MNKHMKQEVFVERMVLGIAALPPHLHLRLNDIYSYTTNTLATRVSDDPTMSYSITFMCI